MSDTFTESPTFLAPTDVVPQALRDLLDEADGCLQSRYLTGGTTCARRALDMLLAAARTEGQTYEERIKSLGEKRTVPQLLTTILVQCGGASERDGAKLTANALEVFLATIKAVVYELYVVGPQRTQRLQYIRSLLDQLEKSPAQHASMVVDLEGSDESDAGSSHSGRRRQNVAVGAR